MTTPTNDGVQEVVQAKRFELVDDDGRVRGEMAVGSDGPILALFNRHEAPQWSAFVSDDGSSDLYFSDPLSRLRLSVSMGSDGTPELALNDENGDLRLSISMESDGTPNLVMRDQNGNIRLSAWLYDDGVPSIDLWDENGNAISR